MAAALPPSVIGKYSRYYDHVRGNVPNPPIKSTATHRGLFFGVNQKSMNLNNGLFTFFLDYLMEKTMQKSML